MLKNLIALISGNYVGFATKTYQCNTCMHFVKVGDLDAHSH